MDDDEIVAELVGSVRLFGCVVVGLLNVGTERGTYRCTGGVA